MAPNTSNAAASSNQFNDTYTVYFNSKRAVRNESHKFVLGHSESSDFVVSSPNVGDKHCEISCSGDSWLIHNLSSNGTSLVGRGIVRNGETTLGEEAIIKLGTVYVQVKPGMEATEPPTRILNLSVLMGEKCHFAGQCEDENEEAPVNNEPSNEDGPTVLVESSNGMVNTATTPDSEVHGIIEEMATANEHTDLELRETKRALRQALLAREQMESTNASLEKQLLECYQREENNKSLLNDLMENELQCSICNEIIIDAVTVSCSHSYCSQCLITWRRNQNICPMCRKNITYEVNARMMNDAVEKIIKCLPEDVQKRRAELIRARRGTV